MEKGIIQTLSFLFIIMNKDVGFPWKWRNDVAIVACQPTCASNNFHDFQGGQVGRAKVFAI